MGGEVTDELRGQVGWVVGGGVRLGRVVKYQKHLHPQSTPAKCRAGPGSAKQA